LWWFISKKVAALLSWALFFAMAFSPSLLVAEAGGLSVADTLVPFPLLVPFLHSIASQRGLMLVLT
jgi:hypothetical protein